MKNIYQVLDSLFFLVHNVINIRNVWTTFHLFSNNKQLLLPLHFLMYKKWEESGHLLRWENYTCIIQTHTHTKEGSGFAIYFVLRLPITLYLCAHGVSAPISFICHVPRTSQPYPCHGTLEELHWVWCSLQRRWIYRSWTWLLLLGIQHSQKLPQFGTFKLFLNSS